MLATVPADELQVTLEVRSCVVLSLKWPVAVNCLVALWVIVGFPGVTEIVCKTGGFTVSRVEPLTPFKVAVIVVWPALWVVARPEALMVATAVFDDAHVTREVRLLVLPLL
jgi:hypothetical protein